jgi:hypothetical protein
VPTVGSFAYCISVLTPRGRLLRRRHCRMVSGFMRPVIDVCRPPNDLAFSCELTGRISDQ